MSMVKNKSNRGLEADSPVQPFGAMTSSIISADQDKSQQEAAQRRKEGELADLPKHNQVYVVCPEPVAVTRVYNQGKVRTRVPGSARCRLAI